MNKVLRFPTIRMLPPSSVLNPTGKIKSPFPMIVKFSEEMDSSNESSWKVKDSKSIP